MADSFWDLSSWQAEQDRKLHARLSQLESTIRAAKAITALKNAPGFKEYEAALQGLIDTTLRKLLMAKEEREVMDLRARVVALKDVLALINKGDESRKMLEKEHERLENSRRPTVRPDGTTPTS